MLYCGFVYNEGISSHTFLIRVAMTFAVKIATGKYSYLNACKAFNVGYFVINLN